MPTKSKYRSAAERQAAYRKRCQSRREEELSEKGLPAVPSIPGYRRWKAIRKQAASLLETAMVEMEAYYEERSEAWQDSERAEEFTEMMESLEEIAALLRELDSPGVEA